MKTPLSVKKDRMTCSGVVALCSRAHGSQQLYFLSCLLMAIAHYLIVFSRINAAAFAFAASTLATARQQPHGAHPSC
jgi:hypothetical protein